MKPSEIQPPSLKDISYRNTKVIEHFQNIFMAGGIDKLREAITLSWDGKKNLFSERQYDLSARLREQT